MANRLIRLAPDQAQRLYGQPILDAHLLRPSRVSSATIGFGVLAWLATLALAFMLGRASVETKNSVAPQSPQVSRAAEPIARGAAKPDVANVASVAGPKETPS